MTDDDRTKHAEHAPLDVAGKVALFGYDSTPATVHLQPRSRSWRVGGSVRTMAVAVVVAMVMVVVPPHVPWLLGALAGGGFLARRRWQEHFTVMGVDGTCPRCGGVMKAATGRLRSPHPVTCEACNFEASVEIPPEALADKAA